MSGRAVLDAKRVLHIEGEDGLTRCGVEWAAIDLHWATTTRMHCHACIQTVIDPALAAGGSPVPAVPLAVRSEAGGGRAASVSPGSEAWQLREAALEAEIRWLRDRAVCSNCGQDYEGDSVSSDCCNCDIAPASDLPSLLHS